jgi:hypothetical protein
MMVTAESKQDRKLGINDSYLPLLVSQAALELDRAARGEAESLSNATRFFAFLRESLETDLGDAEKRWLDPETVDVFEQALRSAGTVEQMHTVQDVIREALQIVEKTKDGLPLDTKELLRFCIAFGNSLLNHRAQYRAEIPANPYRR